MLDCKHILDAIASAIAETLWPTRCVGCDMPGELLCPECAERMPRIDARFACPRCGAPYGYIVCTQCAAQDDGSAFAFRDAHCACSYEGVAKQLVTAYKDHDERRLASLIGHEIAAACPAELVAWADAAVPVPPNPANVRKRGYDHLAPVARACSDELGLPLVDALVSTKAADQRLLSGQQRASNRKGSFKPAAGVGGLPAHILLVDDVLTTGATCTAAAEALLGAGAREVRVACFARVW